jgi:hypothetical protein
MKLIKFTAAAVFALSSLAANAGLLKINGGADATIPASNDFAAFVGTAGYNFGGNLYANQTGSLSLTFNFLAKEASALNTFTSDGSFIDSDTLKSPFSYVKNYAEDDLIEFGFSTNRLAPLLNFVLNGSNVTGDGVVSFAIALDTTYKGIAYDAILFFDDAGGLNDDDNHDDLLIGVKAVQVPESSTLVLMLLGLAGLFGARRLKLN